jgi:hypothetical protein
MDEKEWNRDRNSLPKQLPAWPRSKLKPWQTTPSNTSVEISYTLFCGTQKESKPLMGQAFSTNHERFQAFSVEFVANTREASTAVVSRFFTHRSFTAIQPIRSSEKRHK